MTLEIETLLAIARDQLQAAAGGGPKASGRTVHCYLNDARLVLRALNEQGVSLAQARTTDLQRCLDTLSAHYRSSTLRRIVVGLRRVWQALVEAGILSHNPVVHLHVPACDENPQRSLPLPAPTVKRLLAAPSDSVKGIRDRAILATMVCHGLSIGEVCRLNIADVDLQSKTLRVIGRRGRIHTVKLIAPTAALFRSWLAARALLQPDTSACFISLHWTAGRSRPGQRLSERGVRQMVCRYLAQVGVAQPQLNCQTLHRTYIALTLAAGADPAAVATSLGIGVATMQDYAADIKVVHDNPAHYLAGLL